MNNNLIPILDVTFDGGPCGLKSTSFEYVEQESNKLGLFKVLFVQESARAYFEAHKDLLAGKTVWQKQVGIFELQLDFEKPVREEALYMQKHGERVVVCYDRSLKTNKAYMHIMEYHKLLNHFKITEKEIDVRYTDKLHLMSVAVDKPHLYVKDEERRETLEEALDLDLRLQKIWHDTVIHDNSGTKEDKLERVWQDVLNRVQKSIKNFK